MTDDHQPSEDNLIEVVATVHLGKRRNKLGPGDMALVDKTDPKVIPLLERGWLIPVGDSGA